MSDALGMKDKERIAELETKLTAYGESQKEVKK